MKKMLQVLAIRFLKGRWGSILPAVFKTAAEGGFGEPLKKAYWATSKYKTTVGAILIFVGAGAEATCASLPDLSWTCGVARWIYYGGMVLTAVGLADGGTRAPWPDGTDKEDWVVK